MRPKYLQSQQRCLMCEKRFRRQGSLYDLLWSEDLLCSACRSQWETFRKKGKLEGIPVRSAWVYNDAFSTALVQFKECGDEALKDIFLSPICKELKRQWRGWTLVGMPSAESKKEQRGFDHLEEMFEQLELPFLSPFVKETDADQKEKGKEERAKIINQIHLKEGIELPRKIILVDDVLTTGSTLKGALSCLQREKHRIRIFTAAQVRSGKKTKKWD